MLPEGAARLARSQRRLECITDSRRAQYHAGSIFLDAPRRRWRLKIFHLDLTKIYPFRECFVSTVCYNRCRNFRRHKP